MSLLNNRLAEFLDEEGVQYHVIHHKRDYAASRAAQDTQTPGLGFAKTVVLNADDQFLLVVVPANYHVDLVKAMEWFGAEEIRLATEQEIFLLFSDCEVGAQPPFGNLYGLDTYVSPELALNETITFNAGSHDTAIRMAYQDFEDVAQPQVLDMAQTD